METRDNEVEGLVLELGGGIKVTLYTGLTLEKRHLEMINKALTTHGAKEYERGIAEFAREVVTKIVASKYTSDHPEFDQWDEWQAGTNNGMDTSVATIHTLAKQRGIDVTKN